MDYMSTDFGADCSSRFPFKARTNRKCDRDGFRNRVTLIFDLLTSGSVHAERLL